MSRIGRLPVKLPAGVKGELAPREVRITGPKGMLVMTIPSGVTVSQSDSQLLVAVEASGNLAEREYASRHGLVRSLIQNMVEGVTQGFEKTIELVGAGFRPTLEENKLILTLGFSHPISIDLPEGVKVATARVEGGARGEERHRIVLTGCNKQQVGQLAAMIRRIKKADVYKGKGVRYAGEIVRRKAGKSAVAAGGTGGA